MEDQSRATATDYDGAWKAALELYLESFLRLCFPLVHAAIDWSHPVEFLDKELQEAVRDAEIGSLRVDKLIKVFLLDGREEWLLIHIEVQSQPDSRLAVRMYYYHYRMVDRYDRRVVSLAVLADDSPSFRPGPYEEETLGCRMRFEYPTCKLMDLDEEMLEWEDNPITVVILAHRAAQAGAANPTERKAVKWRLTRRLYERGYEKKVILELFRLIDWLIALPRELEIDFRRELVEYEDQKRMPYITSIERLGREEGMITARQDDVLDVLEVRFGRVPKALRKTVGSIRDEVRLSALLKSAIQVGSLGDFVRLLEGSKSRES